MRIATIALAGAFLLGGCDTTSRVWRAEEIEILFDDQGLQLQREYGVWWNDYFGEMSHALIWFAYNNDTQPWCVNLEKRGGGTANDDLNRSAYVPPAAQRQYVGKSSTPSDMDLPVVDVELHGWRPRQGATQCEATPPPEN
jgi:hypothetical protein